MSEYGKRAEELFTDGYNCAQAVFCAFCDETGLDIDTAARLSSSFGGGMGRLREVCGGVSGALMALGAVCGYDTPGDDAAKGNHYRMVQDYGTIVCRELLKDIPVTPGSVPEPRTPEFYARRPCLRLVGEAAAILDQMLAEMRTEGNTAEKP